MCIYCHDVDGMSPTHHKEPTIDKYRGLYILDIIMRYTDYTQSRLSHQQRLMTTKAYTYIGVYCNVWMSCK